MKSVLTQMLPDMILELRRPPVEAVNADMQQVSGATHGRSLQLPGSLQDAAGGRWRGQQFAEGN